MVLYTDGIVEARAGVTIGPTAVKFVEYDVQNLMDVARAYEGEGPQTTDRGGDPRRGSVLFAARFRTTTAR